MSNWFETHDGIFQCVLDRLLQAADESALVAFATVSADTTPEVRTVVLRAADSDAQVLEIYTDLQSDKITSLRATPKASIVLWDEALKLQIRLQTEVAILSGGAVMDRWRDIPDHSKLSYGITPAPGHIIATSDDYVKAPDPSVFAVLSCRVSHIDAVHLGRPHRRAAFSRVSDWTGKWLAP